jgi:predicted Zn-dependent protease
MKHKHPLRSNRRTFTTGALLGTLCLALSLSGWAREGVEVRRTSEFSKLVSAESLEKAATQHYAQLKSQASRKGALAPDDHPQLVRLRTIAQRLIPFTSEWNPKASSWRWEINLINSSQINAFCMPGGKIAFFMGILQQLQLTDAEVAVIMGHEMAHALREHAREQMGKSQAMKQGALETTSDLFGVANDERLTDDTGAKLLALHFGRADETESDLIGLELAARAGYDPAAGVSLWQKMAGLSGKNEAMQFFSTHPTAPTRIKDLQGAQIRVSGLYAKAPKPDKEYGPPVKN